MKNFEPLCFMRTGGLYMSDDAKERLYATAHEMAQTQERRRTFQMPDGSGEGEITTQYRTSNMGDIGGIQFDAILEVGTRRFDIAFVVNPRQLKEDERGFWITVRFVPADDEDGRPVDPSKLN